MTAPARMSAALAAAVLLACVPARAQDSPATAPSDAAKIAEAVEGAVGPSGAVKTLLVVTVLAVAPAIAVMVTCFTRIVVVLGLLRQALGTQQLPPNQILFGLALFMTAVIMAPVIKDVHQQAVVPYAAGEITQGQAWEKGKKPIRNFMIRQIESCGNSDDVYLFISDDLARRENLVWQDVGTEALIPAFVVSELKTAFLMGFRIFLPFLVVEMLVASTLLSMGMLMLPPTLVSLPFKLLLFVLADGWHLVVGTLMKSFAGG